MVTHRTNLYSSKPSATADDCFAAMQRHHAHTRPTSEKATPLVPRATEGGQGGGGEKQLPAPPPAPGDIIYGARAIALYIFDDDSNTARRRVFNLAAHYRDRNEAAGFFKLKGALCLSKSQWQAFHGLG